MSEHKDQAIILDVTGLLCPLPVLKARKAIAHLEPGKRLKVIATDPAAAIDFPHYCIESGNLLISQAQDGDRMIFEIEKKP